MAFFFIGCNNEESILDPITEIKTEVEANRAIRSTEDVEQIINSLEKLQNITRSHSEITIKPLTTHSVSNFTTRSSSTEIDTLLYIVDGTYNDVIISANVKCDPIIAIFDNPDFSIWNEINNPTEENAGMLTLVENAMIYNESPDVFGEPYGGATNTRRILRILEEVKPKVPVEWEQGAPFNKYAPNNSVAGCVAIATAQAFMVTRHVGTFNGISLDYDRLIKMKNLFYDDDYPTETDIIARLIRQIGSAVGMKYGTDESGANTKDAIRLFTFGGIMNLSTNKADIRKTLRDYNRGIVIISSRTKKNGIFGNARGKGHAYITDGYRIYSDGSDLMHVNYGWGPGPNGYFLTRLWAPYFTSNATNKFPHAWNFYCIYK